MNDNATTKINYTMGVDIDVFGLLANFIAPLFEKKEDLLTGMKLTKRIIILS